MHGFDTILMFYGCWLSLAFSYSTSHADCSLAYALSC